MSGAEDALRFCPVRGSAGAAPSGAAGAAAVSVPTAPVQWGCDQLRRKRPAGGGSVPESTGAATDDASAVAFARLASLFAVAATVACEAISFCNFDLLFICRAQAS